MALRAKQPIIGVIFLSVLLASSGLADAAKRRAKTDHWDEAVPAQTLPVRIYRDFLVVAEGQFAGVPEIQNFVLDTGTAPSVVNATMVTQLGLATKPSTNTTVGKIIPAQAAIIPEVRLGPIRVASLPVRVEDLSRLEREIGIPIAGVIGLDVLSKSSFKLNYDHREIEFGRVSREGIPVHVDARSGIAVAEIRLSGKAVRMLVDTGSNRIVLLGGNFTDVGWLALRNTPQRGENFALQDIPLQVFSAPDIVLGGQHFSTDPAYFLPGSFDPAFDGLLGVRALGFRALSYDQLSGTIFLHKSS